MDKAVDLEPAKSDAKPGRGKGRGRGRGRPPIPAAEKKKTPPKFPYLLTNLVRAGNQMGSSSSWKIILANLKSTVTQKLRLRPLSELTEESANGHLCKNRSVLQMLGKLTDSGGLSFGGMPPSSALNDSAEELLQTHGLFKFAQFFEGGRAVTVTLHNKSESIMPTWFKFNALCQGFVDVLIGGLRPLMCSLLRRQSYLMPTNKLCSRPR